MVAKKYTSKQSTKRAPSNTDIAPPPTAVSDTENVKKNKDFTVACQLYRGQQVVVASQRPNRFHFNGLRGKIAAIIYPQDAERTILYIALEDGGSPCFFAHEVCPILNQKSVGGAV